MTALGRRRWRALVAMALATSVSLSAAADKGAESAARAALDKARKEFRRSSYAAAAKGLEKALRACGAARCAPSTKAEVLRALGAADFRKGDKDPAAALWAEANKIEPGQAPSAPYDAPDVRAGWDEATGGASAGESASAPSTPPAPPPSEPTPPPPPAAPKAVAKEPPAGEVREDRPAAVDGEPSSSAPPRAFARWWIGASGAVDFVRLPPASDVCKLGSNGRPASGDPYVCTTPSGVDFPTSTQNTYLDAGQAGRVDGAFRAGDVRVMLAVDFAVTAHFLVGARLGYVLDAYRGAAAAKDGRALGLPVHGELRATYVFGRNPLGEEGFAPFVFAGGGVAEVDGHATTTVTFNNVSGAQPYVAWVTGGPTFIAIGGGARYLFSTHLACSAAVRVDGALGGGGLLPTVGPEIAIQYGIF